MKLQRSLFYGCLVFISMIYLLALNYVRSDSLYFIILFITHFIFILNYIPYSIKNRKEYISQSLALVLFMIIPILFRKELGWLDFLIISLYLFDLGMILAKLFSKKIHLNKIIKKYIFLFIPFILTFIIPLCFIAPVNKTVRIDGYVFISSQEPPITLLFIFLLSIYLSTTIFLSDKSNMFHLTLAVLYTLILVVPFFIQLFPSYNYIYIQLINSLTIFISYIVITIYERYHLKFIHSY